MRPYHSILSSCDQHSKLSVEDRFGSAVVYCAEMPEMLTKALSLMAELRATPIGSTELINYGEKGILSRCTNCTIGVTFERPPHQTGAADARHHLRHSRLSFESP